MKCSRFCFCTKVALYFQVLLPLLKSDLYEVLKNTLQGKLASSPPIWLENSAAVTVVMASEGYPGAYKKGVEITGIVYNRVQFSESLIAEVIFVLLVSKVKFCKVSHYTKILHCSSVLLIESSGLYHIYLDLLLGGYKCEVSAISK